MTNRRLTAMPVAVVLLLGLVLSGCSTKTADTEATSTASSPTATTSGAAANPTGERVAPADLAAIVSDRTFRGDDGGTYAEYYAPDGSLRGKSDGEAYTGSWKVVGEQLCFTYRNAGPTAGSGEETECYAVYRSGDEISWVDAQGKVTRATFVDGNPDNL